MKSYYCKYCNKDIGVNGLSIKKDKLKTKLAKKCGYRLYRFWGSEIKNNIHILDKLDF